MTEPLPSTTPAPTADIGDTAGAAAGARAAALPEAQATAAPAPHSQGLDQTDNRATDGAHSATDGEPQAAATSDGTASPDEGPGRNARPPRSGGRNRDGNRPAGAGGKPARPAASRTRGGAPHPVLERLFALYPNLFGARFQPLKLGVFQDLLARHPDVFQKDELKVALGLHARSTRYLECVAAGNPRRDLDGNETGPVAPEHVHHAVMELHRRRQARKPSEDLRPALVQQLARAVAASGLDRNAYQELVRATDDEAVALLDEAFAQNGQQAARREALRRAFEASGSTVEAFAAMYGLDPREAAVTLGTEA